MIDLTVVVPLALDQIFFKNCLEFNVIQFARTICGRNVHPRFFGNGIGRNVLDIHVFHNQVGLFQKQKGSGRSIRFVRQQGDMFYTIQF